MDPSLGPDVGCPLLCRRPILSLHIAVVALLGFMMEWRVYNVVKMVVTGGDYVDNQLRGI